MEGLNWKAKRVLGVSFSVFLPTDESVYKPEEKATEQQETEVHTTNNQDIYITETGDIQEKEDITETNKNNKESILIVEDNIDILQYLSDELGKNYQILKAQNGEEAIAIIKEQEVDLVF